MLLYTKEAKNAETIKRYGGGAPSDWIESHVYSAFPGLGIVLLPIIDITLFGLLPGMLVYGIQMAWIPFLAAGVINGMGHFYGYRSYACKDASTNIVPWGILIGGEELHNNHHAFVTSAKLSMKWYEFDIGWMYIRALALCGLAKVKRIAPSPRFIPGKSVCDLDTLQAIITHRYEVLMKYDRIVKCANVGNAGRVQSCLPTHALTRVRPVRCRMPWLQCRVVLRCEDRRIARSDVLDSMGLELNMLWESREATREELLQRLRNWCQCAETSAIAPLQQFARELRCYG
jgi:stearoyl-CoA desaturase (delta-9 desaturase)